MKKLLTLEQAKKLNTKRLLSYYKSLRVDALSLCDCGCMKGYLTSEQKQFYKDVEILRTALKKELATREHIEK